MWQPGQTKKSLQGYYTKPVEVDLLFATAMMDFPFIQKLSVTLFQREVC